LKFLGLLSSRSVGLLVAVGAIVAVLVTGAAAILIRDLYDQSVVETERGLETQSATLAEEADRSFQSIDLLQASVIAELSSSLAASPENFADHLASRAMHDALVRHMAALPQLDGLILVGPDGRVINVTRSWPPPDHDLADRDYFRAFIADPKLQHYISDPLANRADGNRTVFVARRLTAADGSFGGLLLTAVDISYFQRLYEAVSIYPDYTIALLNTDGVLLARYPPLPGGIGGRYPSSAAMQLVASGASHALVRTVSPFDGQDHVGTARLLPHYKLVITNSRLVSASLAPWRRQARIVGVVAVLFDLGLVGVVVLGASQLRGQARLSVAELARRAADERARGEHDLHQQYANFGVALDNMTQGLCMFDAADRLIVANRRLCELFGLAEPLAAGTPLVACLRRVRRAGSLGSDDARMAKAALRVLTAARRPGQQVLELEDGRALSLSFQPTADASWLITCEDITEQRQAAQRIEFLAHHDPLTRLPNRILFRDRLEQAVQLAQRGAQCAVLCLDLDRFKEVNDTLGHGAGDRLLVEVAARLRRCVRDSDTVARLGGDEFAMIQSGLHQSVDAEILATRAIAALSEPFAIDGQKVAVGVSIGIAIAPDDGAVGDRLLKHADMALYWAKSTERGCFRFFDAEMHTRMEARHTMMAALCRAVPGGEFELFFQPLIRVATGRLVGFEALLRWHHPTAGLLAPGKFIALAEEAGLMLPIGEWVLGRACEVAASWPGNPKVAVNLTAAQFKSRTLVEAVRLALQQSGLAAARLDLEITETVLLQETEETLAILHELRALGVGIVMDDFGTGYSSLSYLHKFPFDKVKIDRSFVSDLGRRREATAITRAITGLCSQLDITTVAEGVETEAQLAALRAENCTEVQGFLFSPPVPAGAVAGLLERFAGAVPAEVK
jgi:diguanylate cyclase (GGDEF)-like protein